MRQKLPGEIKPLTSLRFFAALAVLFFHFGSGAARAVGAPWPIVTALSNGYLGVSFFFVLSGFILVFAYQDKLDNSSQLKRFAIARVARLYPVYLIALILAFPVDPPTSVASAVLTPLLLHSWTLPASELGLIWNSPSWTLSVELFFYIVFAMSFSRMSRLPVVAIFAVTALMALITVVCNAAAIAPGVLVGGWLGSIPLPVLRLPEFLLGCGTSLLVLRTDFVKRGPAMDVAFGICALATLALLASSPAASHVAPVFFVIMIATASLSTGPLCRWLSSPWLVFLGGASYAAYLLQDAVNGYFDYLFGNSLIGRAAMPVAVIALACILFRFVEEPARRMIKSRTVETSSNPA